MVHTLPECMVLVDHFRNGALVRSITGAHILEVAPEEAHEVLINKDCKMPFSHCLPPHADRNCNNMGISA